MSTLAIERHKSKYHWVLLSIAALLVILNAVNGIVNYLQNVDIFTAQNVSWQAIWGQGGLLWAILFLPCLIALRAASLTRMEHEGSNWRRLASYGAHLRAYRGKLGLLAGFTLYCQTVFVIGNLVASLLLGFSLTGADITAMLVWGLMGALGGMTIAAIQLTAGIIVRSFATTLAIGIVGTVGGLMVTLLAPPLEAVYPYAQPGVGLRVRTMDWMSVTGAVGFLVWNLALIFVASLIGSLVLRRKEF
ncbi:hypothetical protein EAE32_01010 [Kocuria tytonicola]|uniref:ABC transporter permease n=1 Tax=Kocuria tytonicola TaxID=2055946 RepID=A0A3L9L4Z7_9MICC|nr:ABC transporter permease [Kocuria tytonicola]RLY93860.1 hypothetical protein EAE32_01010 [Kocuria tytonicola]